MSSSGGLSDDSTAASDLPPAVTVKVEPLTKKCSTCYKTKSSPEFSGKATCNLCRSKRRKRYGANGIEVNRLKGLDEHCATKLQELVCLLERKELQLRAANEENACLSQLVQKYQDEMCRIGITLDIKPLAIQPLQMASNAPSLPPMAIQQEIASSYKPQQMVPQTLHTVYDSSCPQNQMNQSHMQPLPAYPSRQNPRIAPDDFDFVGLLDSYGGLLAGNQRNIRPVYTGYTGADYTGYTGGVHLGSSTQFGTGASSAAVTDHSSLKTCSEETAEDCAITKLMLDASCTSRMTNHVAEAIHPWFLSFNEEQTGLAYETRRITTTFTALTLSAFLVITCACLRFVRLSLGTETADGADSPMQIGLITTTFTLHVVIACVGIYIRNSMLSHTRLIISMSVASGMVVAVIGHLMYRDVFLADKCAPVEVWIVATGINYSAPNMVMQASPPVWLQLLIGILLSQPMISSPHLDPAVRWLLVVILICQYACNYRTEKESRLAFVHELRLISERAIDKVDSIRLKERIEATELLLRSTEESLSVGLCPDEEMKSWAASPDEPRTVAA